MNLYTTDQLGSKKLEYDVVIVGAGIIGLSLAVSLGQQGFSVAVLESRPTPTRSFSKDEPHDLRVFAISPRSKKLFNSLEVWPLIKKDRIGKMANIKVWDQDFQGRIEFSAEKVLEENLSYIIEQSNIVQALYTVIGQLPKVDLIFECQLQSVQINHNEALVQSTSGLNIKAKLLCGCDGKDSWVRSQLGLKINKRSYHQQAIVATVNSEKPHQETAYQRFVSSGPLALLPLADPYQSSIVWSIDDALAKELMALTPIEFEQELTKETASVLGDISLHSQRVSFDLYQIHAQQYFADRLALLGDAAHTFHPLAGQGVNFGLRDVQALSQVLIEAKHKNRDIGLIYILKRYERKRKLDNQIMIMIMKAFKEGFGSKLPVVSLLRNEGLDWVNSSPFIKKLFVQALG